ncbi:unnamed protein product, partial [Candidula unifasciata]
MTDKNILSVRNTLLEKLSHKGSNPLTSSLLSGHASLGSGLLSTNLSNPLLDSLSLRSGLTQTTESSLSLSPLKLSSFASSTRHASVKTSVKPGESSQIQRAGLTNLKPHTTPLIETSLTRLSLSQDTGKVAGFDDSKPSLHALKESPRKRHTENSLKTVKKSKVQNASGEITSEVIKAYAVEPPQYAIKCENEDRFMDVDLPKFIPPSKDARLSGDVGKGLTNVTGLKQALLNCISASLLAQPKFTDRRDETRKAIKYHALSVINEDPEFILKVALYARKELNIRTTSNFLLALAAWDYSCRIFLKKYFSAAIALPSDWIEVAEIFQTLEDNNLKLGSLSAALRKSMIAKFPEFDKYQLAKYNKDKSGRKRKRKTKKTTDEQMEDTAHREQPLESDTSESENEEAKALRPVSGVIYDEDESEEALRKQRFTIKHLIRKLHIKEPVEPIMCIIGKKYPKTPEEFYKSRLPGVWEEEKAGKRMKLPVPETWETQVSLKGNKAQTWEDLIDHKKLPFMAMLRNLRNMIKAGISPKHHNNVLRRLTDQRSVVNSKQFPFRFFSAYVVLNELEEAYETNQREIIEAAEQAAGSATADGANKPAGGRDSKSISKLIANAKKKSGQPGSGTEEKTFPWWIIKKMKKDAKNGETTNEVPYDKNLIQRYRKALDTAVKIATVHNVQPIKGRTLLLCEISSGMDRPCSSAKGIGKPRTVREISILMGLMCKYSCEECELLVFNETGFASVSLDKGTILDNMEKVLQFEEFDNASYVDLQKNTFPYSPLFEKLRDRIQVDNLLIFGEGFEPRLPRGVILFDWLGSYRHIVNPNLLFVNVSFSSEKHSGASIDLEFGNNVYITGYSDSILRFIAERGSTAQINHVDKIDVAFQLQSLPRVKKPLKKRYLLRENDLQLMAPKPSWMTVRVFISSTFKDMHGERDLLTRFVFPELRSLFCNRFINIYEVDLRWGLTEEDTRDNRTVEVCLEEVSRCQLFIGVLGERYGWIPDACQIPDTDEYAWIQQYPPGASVTELEMHLGALSKAQKAKDTAVFYLRDNSLEKDVPEVFKSDFKSESEMHKTKMNALKKKIRSSGLEVYDGYPCHWGGCVDGKPMVAGLDEFGARVLNTLANAIRKLCPEKDEVLTEDEHINQLQWAFIKNCSCDFIGRKTLVEEIISNIKSTNSGIIGLVGKPGSGKTTLMASVIQQVESSKTRGYSVFMNIAGAAPGTNSLAAMLRRLSQQINTRFGLGYSLPEDFKNLTLKFKDLLEEAGNICPSKLMIFLDGIDQMDSANEPFSLEWIPNPVPDNVVFVITVVEGERAHTSIKRLTGVQIPVGALDMWDKADIVRQTLAKHRKSLVETGFGNQLKLLMMKKDAHNPLFLKLACEELRVFGVFEKISDKLKSLPHTTAQMLQEILKRLEEDHGQDIVTAAVCLLACAREGLYPEELFELINWHIQLEESKFEPRNLCYLDLKTEIPHLKFSFLARSIMCLLNPSSSWSSLLFLANKEISTAVRLRYLKGAGATMETRLHKLLAGFFLKQADQLRNNTWKGQNARAFAELPYHLACAGEFHELEEVLCNHHFIGSKCSLGLAATLIDDFTPKALTVNKSLEKDLARFISLPRVQQFRSFVSRNIDIFVNYPTLEWQQAINEPSSTIPYKEAVAKKEQYSKLPSYMEWSNKPETESQCYMKLSSFKMPVTCVAISPDSTKFAAGSEDLLVRLFDMGTGKELCFLRGHADEVTDVCFVGNNILCSASADTTLSMWDVENKHRIHTLKGHGRRVNSCAADSRGKLIASGGWDCYVFVWNTSGEKMCEFDTGSPVNCVDFHPTDELVVAGSWDSLIRIYNYFNKTRIAILRGHSSSVRDISYSFNGKHLASASLDGDIKIWAAEKGSQVGNVRGHSGPINKLTFSPAGTELITASDDHQIKVWSGDLGIPLHRLHTDKFGPATSVAISPNGSVVAAGYHLGQIQIYDVNTGVKIAKVNLSDKPVRALTFSPDGSYIYAGCDDGYVQVLESTQGSRVCSLLGHTQPVLCVDTVKKFIATAGEDCICCLYEDICQLKSSKISSPKVVLKGHTAPVSACSFNADGTMLATASRDASIRIYTLFDVFISVDPEPTHILHACHADWINACVWSNTGNFLVTASNDFNLKLWDTKKYTEKNRITGHTSAINAVAYK